MMNTIMNILRRPMKHTLLDSEVLAGHRRHGKICILTNQGSNLSGRMNPGGRELVGENGVEVMMMTMSQLM